MSQKIPQKPIEVTAQELPLHCPGKDAPLWARHPRVYLDITHSGEVVCPYCSAHYVLRGERPKGHH
ncbi:zinc-finger domain-containing protein [Candidatus Accumulibacter vicinus]|uniref:Zinc-finger domain protein n=1 Tax=Candidatus Accumulibacter vicinus TaxID=2954382 RepID=A0A084Y177_9PROT|nr:zinc-finger domain-containing protein [Candidatus Accumulibacter vicinus]KFB68471.1 MAG: Zinc-finger domain protein [Candidatus Accumulibacter vicinus]